MGRPDTINHPDDRARFVHDSGRFCATTPGRDRKGAVGRGRAWRVLSFDHRVAGSAKAGLTPRLARAALQVTGFCALTALLAQVRIVIPGTPVPMTLHSTAVLLTGYFLPVPLTVAAMTLYIAAGLVGIPVFAPGSLGLAGVTGGYIVGFVLGAAAVSLLRGRSGGWLRLALAGASGTAVIFLCGVLWQIVLFDVTWLDAVRWGVLPFLPKEAVQLGVAVAAAHAIGNGERGRYRLF